MILPTFEESCMIYRPKCITSHKLIGSNPGDQVSHEHKSPLVLRLHVYEELSNYVLWNFQQITVNYQILLNYSPFFLEREHHVTVQQCFLILKTKTPSNTHTLQILKFYEAFHHKIVINIEKEGDTLSNTRTNPKPRKEGGGVLSGPHWPYHRTLINRSTYSLEEWGEDEG